MGQARLDDELKTLRAPVFGSEELAQQPPIFTPNTKAAVAACTEAAGAGVGDEARQLLFDACWIRGLNIGSRELLRALLAPVIRSSSSPAFPLRGAGFAVSMARGPITLSAYRRGCEWHDAWMRARLPFVGGALGSVGKALTALGPEGLAAGAALAATGYLVHELFVANAADAKSAAKEVADFYRTLALKTSNGNARTTAQLQSELKARQDHLDSLKEQARQATSVLDQMQTQRENATHPDAATDADGAAAVQADAAIVKQSSAVHQLNLEVSDSAKKQAALSEALKQRLTASAGDRIFVSAYRLQGSAASDLAADITKMADLLASVSDKVTALTQSFNDLSSLEGGDVVRATQNVQKSLNCRPGGHHRGDEQLRRSVRRCSRSSSRTPMRESTADPVHRRRGGTGERSPAGADRDQPRQGQNDQRVLHRHPDRPGRVSTGRTGDPALPPRRPTTTPRTRCPTAEPTTTTRVSTSAVY